MRHARTFLVVAEDTERLFLISSTLHRKFPNSVVQTCRDSEAALEVARTQQLDAIVTNRSADLDSIPLLESLRAVTSTPILLMSDANHAQQAVAAGAAGFLNNEQWLLIGTTVGKLIGATPRDTEEKLKA
jgi:DNA-binding response OmpR family regulator